MRPLGNMLSGMLKGIELSILMAVAVIVRIVYFWQSWVANISFHFPQSDQMNYLKIGALFRQGEWLAVDSIYTAPLYPYFTALLQHPWLIALVQMFAGVLTTWVVYDLGKRYYNSSRAGFWAALLFNLCGPLLCYEAKIYPTSLAIDALLFGLWLLEKAKENQYHPRMLLAAGSCFAVAVGFITSQLLSYVLLMRGVGRGRWQKVGLFALPLLLLLAAFSARNYFIDRSFMPLGANMGMNLAIGHQLGSDGGYKILPGFNGTKETEQLHSKLYAEAALQKPLTWSEVDSFWRLQAITFIWQHPLEELILLGKKIGLVFSEKDLSSEIVFVYERQLTSVLRFLPLSFLALCLLAFLSPALGRPWPRSLAIVFFVVVLTNLLFFVTERLRLPAAAMLTLPAGAALEILISKGATRRLRSLQIMTLLFVGGLIFNHVTAMPTTAQQRMGDFNRAIAFEAAGRFVEAAALHEKMYNDKPAALIAHSLARLSLAQQDLQRAQHWVDLGLTRYPRSVELHNDQGVIALRRKDYRLAKESFQKVLELDKSVVVAYRNLGLAFVGLQQYKEAFPIYQEYVKLAPRDQRGWQELQQLQRLSPPSKK